MSQDAKTLTSSNANYPAATAPDYTCPFEPNSYIICVSSAGGDAVMAISFDGSTDCLILREGKASACLAVAEKSRKVFIKKISGTTGSPTVDVMVQG